MWSCFEKDDTTAGDLKTTHWRNTRNSLCKAISSLRHNHPPTHTPHTARRSLRLQLQNIPIFITVQEIHFLYRHRWSCACSGSASSWRRSACKWNHCVISEVLDKNRVTKIDSNSCTVWRERTKQWGTGKREMKAQMCLSSYTLNTKQF